MPVKPILKPALLRNGLGTFVLPCHKVVVQYCNWGGSSKGVREILSNGALDKFAKLNSQLFIEIQKKSGHPKLKFQYGLDKSEEVDVRNKAFPDVLKLLDEYSQRSGIWSPMHEHKGYRFKI